MPYVCVTMTEKDVKSTLKAAKGLRCDIIEVRLDHMSDTRDLAPLAKLKQKVMVTCMPLWEGGKFRGPEGARVRLLMDAMVHADYVSIELKTYSGLRDELVLAAQKAKAKAIIAYHDFKSTPPLEEIIKVLKAEARAGADIAKVAYMPRTAADVTAVLMAQASCGLRIPVIALSMGEKGSPSRIAAPMLGGYLTFAAPSAGKKAAAGQYTLDEMNTVKFLFR
ncbi:MAG: type I 3-dehydroquinate dehydratase [Candidatus Altiarchaeota archaeon]